MSVHAINKNTYEKKHHVEEYINLTIQKQEKSIFTKYRNEIEGKRILDIGCGTGRTTSYLNKHSNDCIGIDYSLEMIRYCREKYPDKRFELCDARDMSRFDDSSMDFVLFSFNGLGYLCHDDRICTLAEIHRVLEAGKYFVFSSHNRSFLNQVWNGKSPTPKLKTSKKPRQFLRNLRSYLISSYNYRKNKQFEQIENEYSIIVGVSHNHGLLSYWINAKNQVEQLKKAGFETVETYDFSGRSVALDADERESP